MTLVKALFAIILMAAYAYVWHAGPLVIHQRRYSSQSSSWIRFFLLPVAVLAKVFRQFQWPPLGLVLAH